MTRRRRHSLPVAPVLAPVCHRCESRPPMTYWRICRSCYDRMVSGGSPAESGAMRSLPGNDLSGPAAPEVRPDPTGVQLSLDRSLPGKDLIEDGER